MAKTNKRKVTLKNKPRYFVIKNDVYPFDIIVSINQTDKQFVSTMANKLPPKILDELKTDPTIVEFAPTTLARTMMFTSGQMAMRFTQIPSTSEELGAAAHEIFHCVEFLFRHINLPLTDSSSEAYAYMIGYITKKFYEKLYNTK